MARMTNEEAYDTIEKFYGKLCDEDNNIKPLSKKAMKLAMMLWTSESIVVLLPFISLYTVLKKMKEEDIEYKKEIVHLAIEPCERIEAKWIEAEEKYGNSESV